MTRILFVCTGNTCRSPMAEAILREMGIQGLEVRSAGVFAQDGSAASRNTIDVLKEQGIESDHRSSMLTDELINWTNYIFTMTNGHKESVIRMYPHAADKTFTLKEFAGKDADGDISDPFGGPIEVYRETYTEIHSLITEIIHKLKGEDSGGA